MPRWRRRATPPRRRAGPRVPSSPTPATRSAPRSTPCSGWPGSPSARASMQRRAPTISSRSWPRGAGPDGVFPTSSISRRSKPASSRSSRAPSTCMPCSPPCTRLLGRRPKRKGLSLELAIDERLASVVMGDPVRIRQILGNFIANAVKFTRRRRLMRAPAAERVRLEVVDTGVGIDADLGACCSSRSRKATRRRRVASAAPAWACRSAGNWPS